MDRRLLLRQLAACGAVLVLSALYYSRYIDSGFNYADDGNYAQIAYELMLGRDPHDMAMGYGVLWFKLGEALFRLFGASFASVQALFFTCLTLTNVLVFVAVFGFTGSIVASLLATAVPLLVPAFPATAFYSLCVVANVVVQLRLAQELPAATPRSAFLAGAVLSVTSQIRPDFGYVFLVPLIVLIAMGKPRQHLAAATAAGFVIALVPLLIAAGIGGYLDLVWAQYASYPQLMVGYFVDAVRHLFGASAGGTPAGTFLPRPPLRDIFSPNLSTAAQTLLIYLPLLGTAGFALYFVLWLRRDAANRDWPVVGQSVVAFCAAAATLPHYFLFRPDLPHVANFMAGYVILAAFLLWRLTRQPLAASKGVYAGRSAMAGVLIANLIVYVIVGMNSRATGSIGLREGRDQLFEARNGVDVWVDKDEKAQLDFLKAAIEDHSQAGDKIVCLPYCPGVAFMTERRMLLSHFFADDSFPGRMPDWLDRTIATTKDAMPPVVVLMDWPLNGTQASRVSVWGARYVEALEGLSGRKLTLGLATVYLLGNAEKNAPDAAEKAGSPPQ